MALRRLYCDAKDDGDERGRHSGALGRKLRHILRERRGGWWGMIRSWGIADAAAALGADLFRYLGSEHKERRFLSWRD
jgi:hypothetical protein